MRSSSGEYHIALDHLRGLAALMVFVWHFTRGAGTVLPGPIPRNYTPDVFPLAFFDEGHVGVALFMALSGFLFANLLDGKRIAWGAFYYNRAARLLPLLLVALFLNGVSYDLRDWMEPGKFFDSMLPSGILFPTLPGGAWSITVEWHFYMLLPALLWLIAKGKPAALLGVVAGSVLLRTWLHATGHDVAGLGYWTMVGRIDQFAFGMLAWHYRHLFAGNHRRSVAWLIVFAALVWFYDWLGGLRTDFAGNLPAYVSILTPTVLGAGFAILVAWYSGSFKHSTGPVSTFMARAGEYSYSIYLLHVLFVFDLQLWLTGIVPGIHTFAVAMAVAVVCFAAFVPIAGLSYRYIELPFLRRRKPYVLKGSEIPAQAEAARA